MSQQQPEQYAVHTYYYNPTWNGGRPVNHIYGPFAERKDARRFGDQLKREFARSREVGSPTALVASDVSVCKVLAPGEF